MKKITVILTALAVFMLAGSASFAVTVDNKSNEVEITPVENLHLGNSIEKVWTLSFSPEESPITVALRKTPNGKEYLVRSEFFEVIYAVGKQGFGVKRMNGSKKEVPILINAAVLNEKEMQNQVILTPNKVSDDEALSLIASYLPDLLNDDYKHLIY